jgi:hypothetical protein
MTERVDFKKLQEQFPHLKPTDMSNVFYRGHMKMDSICAKHRFKMRRDFPYLYRDKSP